MSTFWSNNKSNLKCEKEPYNKLLELIILKNNYNKYEKKLSKV